MDHIYWEESVSRVEQHVYLQTVVSVI